MSVLVVAHRGFHPDGDENTLAAFRRAEEVGADMIELDVQETADGELVVLHDDYWNGVPLGGIRLDELRREAPEGVAPRLAEVLDSVQLPALVEIKRADPLRVVWAVEERARAPFAVASFDPATIRAVAASGTRRALILGEDGISAQAPEQDMLARAESARADFLVIQKGLATAGAVAALAEKLAPSFVWDVDDAPTLAVIAREEGVAAVVTDRPDVALRVRDEVS